MKDHVAAAYRDFKMLGIDVKTATALIENRILTLRDLASLTDADLLGIPGIGQKSLFTLKRFVRKQIPRIRRKDRPTTILTTFPPDLFSAIAKWSERHNAGTHAEAVRRLVEMGLGSEVASKERHKPSAQ